ncbi:trypsin-like peptidase domain-containing protein [Streptomyces sp. NPDC059618]|uniref:trypsin-like peptidase domain-containing protein n=1 Tax=Streptomyces sp. NPDC059618 TaxID=3346887 RepID=UPI00367D468B
MAGRGPRTGYAGTADGSGGTGYDDTADGAGRTGDDALVRLCDLAGRPRGTGFAADHDGTVVTSHEAVEGLDGLVLHAPGGRARVLGPDDVTPLPGLGLALVHTEGLGLVPLPVTVRDRVATGTYVRLAAGGWREARVLDSSAVTYTADGRTHLLDGALELAIGTAGADALRPGGGASGGPVLDARTGAVVAVVCTTLVAHTPSEDTPAVQRAPGLAVPLRAAAGPLAELLARNAATVPAYGDDLNLAAALELTATSVGSDGPRPPVASGTAGPYPGIVERDDVARELASFENGRALVLGLVGPPGSGRTTELAALAARRLWGRAPAPTLWLRGADLRADDTSVADAATRALERAGRIVAASRRDPGETGAARRSRAAASVLPPEGYGGELGDIAPDRLAGPAHAAGRPLLLLLDSPEEMPPELAHRLPDWTGATAAWLTETGARLVIACRPEHWEAAGAEFPADLLHRPAPRPAAPWTPDPDGRTVPAPGGALPPCVPLGELSEDEGRRARSGGGIPEGVLAPGDANRPLVLRLLSEVLAAPVDPPSRSATAPGAGPLDRDAVFAAHLDLMCLRVAVRLADANGLRGTAVRRLAARVSGQVHEAARRCLGPGQGRLYRASFESVFPWGPARGRLAGITGWASAVLTEGLLVPAGDGYRFAHEELADWIQGSHLDLTAALDSLVHRARARVTARRGAGMGSGMGSGTGCDSGTGIGTAAGSRTASGSGTSTGTSSGDAVGGGSGTGSRIATGTGSGPGSSSVTGTGTGTGAGTGSRLGSDPGADPVPVPRHRIGPVVEALLLSARHQDTAEPALRLEDLVHAVDELLPEAPDRDTAPHGPTPGARAASPSPRADSLWWATRLLTTALLRVPDATPYTGALRLLTERIVAWRQRGRAVPEEFGPAFWVALPVPDTERFDLLRRLVVADPRRAPAAEPPCPGGTPAAPRHLDTVSRLLAADPIAVHRHLTRWFDDERPLPATPNATVATAAQALLYAHRRRAPDDLAEALTAAAHPRGDELLAVLAEEEPSAVCRAVDRWARDERPARRAAAVAHGLRAAPFALTPADRELLRGAALAVLARPADRTLHGAALGILVRDPLTRGRSLPQALERFAAADPRLPPGALAAALATDPEPVLAAFRDRLLRVGPDTAELLRALADVTTPALARPVAALVRETVEACPAAAACTAADVDRRIDHGNASYEVLFHLVGALLETCGRSVRGALAQVLATPGAPASAPLRRELLDLLLAHERDPVVLDTVLRAAADGLGRRGEAATRELVHRVGLLLVRTPAGATAFDRGLTDLARRVPGFAVLVAGWVTGDPRTWSGLVGPGTRHTIESLTGARAPV